MNHSDQRPIVCGTDFSTQAMEAANVASAMATRLGAPLLLVHGLDERGDIPSAYWPSIEESVRPTLEVEAERLRNLGTQVKGILSGGVPDEGVAACAERADAQMIVLAASGQGALGRWLLGSVSERVAESAWVPSLVLRAPERMLDWAHGGKPLRVFVGADFGPQSDAALEWASQLREIGPCEYTVGFVDRLAEERAENALHAPPGSPRSPEMQQMFEHDLRERAGSFVPPCSTHIRVLPTSGHVEAHLIEMAREASADLIVVGTHQWHGLSRLRHSSVSRRLLHASHINVACVPPHHVVSANSPCAANARRVIVATDLLTHGSAAIPHAFSMLQLGGTAWLLHVSGQNEQRETQLDRLKALIPTEAEQQGFQVKPLVVHGDDVATTICEAARRFDADLICIGSHGSAKRSVGATHSTAHSVIAHSPCPVLVVPHGLS